MVVVTEMVELAVVVVKNVGMVERFPALNVVGVLVEPGVTFVVEVKP